jgi:cell division protein FtsX
MEKEKNIVDFLKPRERETLDNAYFDNLAASIVSAHPKVETKKIIPLYKKTTFWISSIAAVFIGLIALKTFTTTSEKTYNFNSVSHSELMAYVEDNIDEFDQDLLVKYIPIESPTIMKAKELIEQKTTIKKVQVNSKTVLFDDLQKEDILNYLDSEELSIDDLEPEI